MRQARQPLHCLRVCCFIVLGGFSLFCLEWNYRNAWHFFAELSCSRRGDEGAPLRPTLGELRPLGEFYRTHRITTDGLYERIIIKSIEYHIRVRALRWVGHVARMDKTRLPRRLLTAWVANSRPTGGTEMTYVRSLERLLKHTNLPIEIFEWSKLAQYCYRFQK
jgi:hypothetical protein